MPVQTFNTVNTIDTTRSVHQSTGVPTIIRHEEAPLMKNSVSAAQVVSHSEAPVV